MGDRSRSVPANPLFQAASYNVHRCIGLDRKQDPDRIAEVLRELKADIIGLQEVDSSNSSRHARQLERIAETAGFHSIAGTTVLRQEGRFGNALLTGRRAREIRRIDLSHRRREPRGAIDVDLEIDGRIVRVIVTHLGLRPSERRFQVRRLLDVLTLETGHLTVVMGDINEWFPGSRPLRWLHGRLGRAPARRTFPSFLPVLALDRIWVWPRMALKRVQVHDSPSARVASDHLPIKASIDVTVPILSERRRIAPPRELFDDPETHKIGV